ncbi:MAG: S46 family peptidase [Bacteroidales bacterium]|nr:S46 family peptidase [Bacteroidales bacterium]
MKKFFTTVCLSLMLPLGVFAQGGMWLPSLLQANQKDMQSKGARISASDIYNETNPSVKDAVVLFGRGCTGEFVSNQGLLFTNHHCGYGEIVKHSTVDHDYLTNGFAAKSKDEELPCPGLTVTLLQYMKDVTDEVLQGVSSSMTEQQRSEKINKNIETIVDNTTKGTNLNAYIKPLYYGNQYMLYVNKIYKDVRLVAAPPSNIGKFGGDTDNWMWPRHTGDFSVFRVYANADNEPAEYSKDNKPYQPKKFLKISLKDKQEGDFTFVMGYPGTTQQFLTSYAVEDIQNLEDPARIKLRDERLKVYNQAMNSSPAQRLRYASDVASIANGWKKWQGEVKGLKFLNAVEKKKQQEISNSLMPQFKQIYDENRKYKMEQLYITEAVLASDFMQNTRRLLNLINASMTDTVSDNELQTKAKNTLYSLEAYYDNDFKQHREVDSLIFVRTMIIFYNDFAKDNYTFLRYKVNTVKSAENYFAQIYGKSILNNPDKIKKLLKNYKRKDYKKLQDDVAVEFLSPIWGQYYNSTALHLKDNRNKLDSLYRIHVAKILEEYKAKGNKDVSMNDGIFPDANLTLRVTYGNIAPFKPKDGVEYRHYTTIAGIMEKEDPNIYDYVVEQKLKDIYYNNDMAPYGDRVAFIATNHTTGGNSGSPVMDADGNLIGLNFDRNWEGTMSDVLYDKDLCRNITLDIRYCLLIIDKYLEAQNLIDELEIIK